MKWAKPPFWAALASHEISYPLGATIFPSISVMTTLVGVIVTISS